MFWIAVITYFAICIVFAPSRHDSSYLTYGVFTLKSLSEMKVSWAVIA